MLTSELDFATDRVCQELEVMGTSFLRLNRETLNELSFTLIPKDGLLLCRKGDDVWNVGPDLCSVWWRQGTFDRNHSQQILSIARQLERSQWSAFMRSLMVFDQANWINHPSAVYQAEIKALQLHQAAKVGFDVPETFMTNDQFAEVETKIGPKVALKSVDTLLLSEGDEQLFGYTTITSWEEIADNHFHLAPATIQAPLLEKTDLRVTVIDGKLWCVTIKQGGIGIEGDWRLSQKSEIEIEDYELPLDVSTRCLELVRDLGLKFGAIDLAISQGRYWFIEINPTGEWGWLDSDTRPLAPAIAELLGRSC